MLGWGPKSSVCPSKPGKSNIFGRISRDFARISRRHPKSLRKKGLCSICGPYAWGFFSRFSGVQKLLQNPLAEPQQGSAEFCGRRGSLDSGKKKTNKHKHFRRDGVRDKHEPSLGQTGPLPGTNWDPSLGQTGLFLFNSTVKSPFCPVCPWDEKCLCVFCLLVFCSQMDPSFKDRLASFKAARLRNETAPEKKKFYRCEAWFQKRDGSWQNDFFLSRRLFRGRHSCRTKSPPKKFLNWYEKLFEEREKLAKNVLGTWRKEGF